MNFPNNPAINDTYTFNGRSWKWNGDGWEIVIADVLTGYTGASTITTLGTITAGSWQGGIIGVPFGGTGLSAYTPGNFLYASGTTTLGQRTPAQVLSDIGALAATSYTGSDVLTKLLTVDGIGSLLDADLLDGQHGSYYLTASNLTGTLADARLSSNVALKNGSNDFTSTFTLSAGGSSFSLKAGATVDHVYMSYFADSQAQGTRSGYMGYGSGGTTALTIANEMTNGHLDLTTNGTGLVKVNGGVVWHASNDGAGSTLDADLLDGQHGSYYLSYGNLTGVPATFTPSTHVHTTGDVTSGTFANARISQASVTQHQAALSIAWNQLTGSAPTLLVTNTYAVASQAAQLALVAESGDIAIRSDLNKSFVHNGGVAGTMADWSELLTPTDTVISFNGRIGAIVPTAGDYTKADVGLAAVENTALSTWAGSANVTTLGAISSGTWNGNTITAPFGGTGLSSYTPGNYLYASGTTTLAQRTPAQVLTDIGALATTSYTGADVLSKLLVVDGVGSLLDADLLDGLHASAFSLLTGANFTGAIEARAAGVPQIVARSGASSPVNLQLTADGVNYSTLIQGWRDTVGAIPLQLQPAGGSVGIGLAANVLPVATLDVQNTSYYQMRLGNTGTQKLWLGSVWDTVGSFIANNARYESSYQYMPNSTAASGVQFAPDGNLVLWANSGLTSGTPFLPSPRITITSTGLVGFGTSTPNQKLTIQTGGIRFDYLNGAPAPTAALAGLGAGNIPNGTYIYKVQFITALGDATVGTSSTSITVVDKTINGQITVTIPVSPDPAVINRRIWRSNDAGATWNAFTISTINNNTATTWVDNLASPQDGYVVLPTLGFDSGAIYANAVKALSFDTAGNAYVGVSMVANGGRTTDNNGSIAFGLGMLGTNKSGIYVADNFNYSSSGAYIAGTISSATHAAKNVFNGQKAVGSNPSNLQAAAGHVANFEYATAAGGGWSTGVRVQSTTLAVLNTGTSVAYTSHNYSLGVNSLTNFTGYYSFGQFATTGSTITNHRDFHAGAWSSGSGGIVTNRYGLYIDFDNTVVTNAWGIYQTSATLKNHFAGKVLLGTLVDDGINLLQVNGGVGVTGNSTFNGYVAASGQFRGTTGSYYFDPVNGLFNIATGYIYTLKGSDGVDRMSFAGTTSFYASAGPVTFNNTTLSSSTTTGAVIIAGGLGVAGNGNFGGTLNASVVVLSGQSLTAAQATSLVDLSTTWNTTGNPTGLKFNVTNTASGATSKLCDFQVGGVSKFSIGANGWIQGPAGATMLLAPANAQNMALYTQGGGLVSTYGGLIIESGSIQGRTNAAWIYLASGSQMGFGSTASNSGSNDAAFARNAAGVIEVNNGSIGTFADLKLRNLVMASGTLTGNSSTMGFGATDVVVGSYLAAGNNILTVQANTGAASFVIECAAQNVGVMNSTMRFGWGSQAIAVANAATLRGTLDTSLARNAAGIVEVNNGTAGTFADLKLRTLLAGGGATQTANAPVIDASQIWNNAAVSFTGIKSNITDTASAATSLLVDLQIGGVSKFAVAKDGALVGSSLTMYLTPGGRYFGINNNGMAMRNNMRFQWGAGATDSGGAADTGLARLSAGVTQVEGFAGVLGDLKVSGLLGNTSTLTGNVASTSTTTGTLIVTGGVGISGALNATTKSFIIPHPTKPDTLLRHGSLEGPEFGVYARGKGTSSEIILPEYWEGLVDFNTITVNLTAIGGGQHLVVESVNGRVIKIKNTKWFGKAKTLSYFYTVFAERSDVDKLEVES